MQVVPTPEFQRQSAKLYARNPLLRVAVEKKILHIASHPEHYKPLRGRMKGFRRVHFGSYVLVYRLEDDVLYLVALDHHDFAY